MRENTRCEVDEPMSTPTERTHSSSSSPKVRPVEEKRCARPGLPRRSFLRQQPAIIALVVFGPHAVLGAFFFHALRIFLAQERILHVIGDRGAAFGNVHGGVVGVLLARRTRL